MEVGIGHFPTHDAVSPGAFARVVHWIPSGNGAVVEAALERWETAIAQLNGAA
ncbi:MAG: hypothetical protein ABI355_09775 [Solirubrobacteraceae bacterium]